MSWKLLHSLRQTPSQKWRCSVDQKYGVYLDRVTIAQPPYEYESRLQEMFPEIWRGHALKPIAYKVFKIGNDPPEHALTLSVDATHTGLGDAR